MQRRFETRRLIEFAVAIALLSVGIAAAMLVFNLDKKIDANRDTDAASVRQIQGELNRSAMTDVDVKARMSQIARDVTALQQDVATVKMQQPGPSASPTNRKRPR